MACPGGGSYKYLQTWHLSMRTYLIIGTTITNL
jgi:hypothetical protein